MINTHKKLLKASKAGTAAKLSLFFYLAEVFDTNGKNTTAAFLYLLTSYAFTFWITLYQAFSNLHWYFPCWKYPSITYIKYQKWKWKINTWPKKLWLIRKTYCAATCYSSKTWLSISDNGLTFLFSPEDIKTDFLIKYLKILTACLEPNTQLNFLIIKKQYVLLKNRSVPTVYTRVHASIENLTINRTSYLYFVLLHLSLILILLALDPFLFSFRH